MKIRTIAVPKFDVSPDLDTITLKIGGFVSEGIDLKCPMALAVTFAWDDTPATTTANPAAPPARQAKRAIRAGQAKSRGKAK